MRYLRDLKVDAVSLVDRAAVRDPQNKSEPRRFLLWKRADSTPQPSLGGDMSDTSAALLKAENERLRAELSKLSAKRRSVEDDDIDETDQEGTDVGRVQSSEERPDADEAGGIESEVEKAALAKAERELALLRKQAEDAEKIAKAERDLRIEREYVQKAEREFQNLSQDPEFLGPLLKRAAEQLSETDYTAFETVLKAADSQAGTNELLREVGRTGTPPQVAEDAFGEVKKKAEELRKADSSLTHKRALELATRENPELEARMMREGGPTLESVGYARRF